jgi:Ni/Co efflux regulator RcnB
MRKKAVAIIIIACILGTGQFPVAHAAVYGRGQGSSQEDEHRAKRNQPQKPSPQQQHQPPQHYQAHKPPSNYHNNRYRASNSWNSRHGHFRPGHAMPQYYHHDYSRYVVHNWRSYDLYEPPHGHNWLVIDGNFILVAAATGIVAYMLMGR